jgi:hypothetical protein
MMILLKTAQNSPKTAEKSLPVSQKKDPVWESGHKKRTF